MHVFADEMMVYVNWKKKNPNRLVKEPNRLVKAGLTARSEYSTGVLNELSEHIQ